MAGRVTRWPVVGEDVVRIQGVNGLLAALDIADLAYAWDVITTGFSGSDEHPVR